MSHYMHGPFRSNDFRVHDVPAFVAWMAGYGFNSKSDTYIHAMDDDTPGCLVHLRGESEYPNAMPRVFNPNTEEWGDADLPTFVAGFRQHMLAGEVFHLVAGGAEDHPAAGYVGFSELFITDEDHLYSCSFTDDLPAQVIHRMHLLQGAK